MPHSFEVSVCYYQFSASSLPVLCRYFAFQFEKIALVSGFEASVWYPLLLPVFCKFSSALCFVPCGDLLTCYARGGGIVSKSVKLRSSGSQNAQQIIQNETLGASGDLLEASRFQDREKVSAPDTF